MNVGLRTSTQPTENAGSAGIAESRSKLPAVIPAKAGIQKDDKVEKQYFVYILASKRNGTIYTGITSNLARRVWQHKQGLVDGFTAKYKVKMLVYYEVHNDPESAITREKQIKKWNRAWKLRLIEEKNPHWNDLYKEIL